MPLMVSETATALSPPKTAYKAPTMPISHTMIQMEAVSLTARTSFTLNRPFIPKAPEYRTKGRKLSTRKTRNMPLKIWRVWASKRFSRNCGTVVMPAFQ